MRTIRSLRWRMQAWYTLILITVLAVFGGVVYYMQWQARIQDVDVQLEETGDSLMARLFRLQFRRNNQRRRRPPPGQPVQMGRLTEDWKILPALNHAPVNGERTGKEVVLALGKVPVQFVSQELARNDPENGTTPANNPEPPPVEPPEPLHEMVAPPEDAPPPPDQPLNRRPRGFRFAPLPPGGPRPNGQEGPPEWRREFPRINIPLAGNKVLVEYTDLLALGFPDELALLFDSEHDAPYYFAVWDHRGSLVLKTLSTPSEVLFPVEEAREGSTIIRHWKTQGSNREMTMITRFGVKVSLGKSLIPELQAQHATGLWLLLAGTGVTFVGMAGGTWISNRAIAPIQQMAMTAESISGRNLSGRINVQETDSELGSLANVLNQAFDRLQDAFEQQVRFTADASHELRTPVAILVSQTELTLARTRSAEEYQESLKTCRRTALRMRSLVEGLLFLARFDAGGNQTEASEFDLARLAEECTQDLTLLAEQQQISITKSLSPAFVKTDRNGIIQVLTNLVTNAIRYNRPNGTIHISTKSEGHQAVLKIEDTGIGISAEDLPHVFERFYRVDKARTISEGGTGLGLAICKSIVDSLGGEIRIESRIDSGTSVEIRLPLDEKQSLTEKTPSGTGRTPEKMKA